MKIVQNQITLPCSPEKAWDLLTQSEYTKQYMFGCDVISDWQVGSTLLWRGKYQDQEMVFVSGYILEMDRPNSMVYSVIDPQAPYPHTPENHLKVRYSLQATESGTLLTVAQYGFEEAAEGEKRYTEVHNGGAGWQPILEEIKKLV